MQSWGTSSRFTERESGLEPSKSGVIGLLCAALGKPRAEEPHHADRWPALEELARLQLGVRFDRPGHMGVDFQTAGGGRLGGREYGVITADGKPGGSVMSWRYYLADASFLVGLAGENEALLRRLDEALRAPVWQLYLGRKAYLPSVPVYLANGLQEGDLSVVLRGYPLVEGAEAEPRLLFDDPAGQGTEVRSDVPLDFARRRFGVRRVRVEPFMKST